MENSEEIGYKEPSIEEDVKDITFGEICFVKAIKDTRCLEINDENGLLKIKDAAHSSNGEIPRLTNHFSINHLVKNNFGGEWSTPSLVIIMPGEKTVEINDNPRNLAYVDTYWFGDIIVPQGSILLWRDDVEALNTGDKYTTGTFEPDNKLVEGIDKAQEYLDNVSREKIIDPEKVQRNESLMNLYREKLQNQLQKVVIEEIKSLGYKEIYSENGVHSSSPSFDDAIHKLAEKIGASSQTHANTFPGSMENPEMLGLGPYWEIININKNGKDSENKLGSILEEFIKLLEDYKEDIRKGEVDIIQSFAGELNRWKRQNRDFNDMEKELINKFVEQYPETKNIIEA